MDCKQPHIVAIIHNMCAELTVEFGMRHIVPCDERYMFHGWMSPEFSKSGNPHHHGMTHVAGDFYFECVVADEDARDQLPDAGWIRRRRAHVV